MKKIESTEIREMIPAAEAASGDAVYPLSVAEGIQTGEICTSGDAVLFRHQCGFAFLSGKPDDTVLRETEECMLSAQAQQQRFVLITEDAAVISYFGNRPGIASGRRIYYEAAKAAPEFDLPEGYELRRTDAELAEKLTGKIVPSWSWPSTEQFLQNGIGYCILHGDDIAASAFTAAVTEKYTDIGVETAEAYRRSGLAKIAAAAVMREVQAQGKLPVWAHKTTNLGSLKVAEALGFLPVRICKTFEIA